MGDLFPVFTDCLDYFFESGHYWSKWIAGGVLADRLVRGGCCGFLCFSAVNTNVEVIHRQNL